MNRRGGSTCDSHGGKAALTGTPSEPPVFCPSSWLDRHSCLGTPRTTPATPSGAVSLTSAAPRRTQAPAGPGPLLTGGGAGQQQLADQVSQGHGKGPAAGTEWVRAYGIRQQTQRGVRGSGRHMGVGEKGLQLGAEPSWRGAASLGLPFSLDGTL